MNNKMKIIIGVVVAVLVIGLVIILIPKDKKKKKEEKKDTEEKIVIEQTFDLEDVSTEALTISDIKLEIRQKESVLRFVVKNNTDIVYPEGMMNFKMFDEETELGSTSTFVTEIEAHGEVDVEVVINEVYSNVTSIKVINE